MGIIRKQTIVSSLVVYLGFAVGALNIYFFTRNGSFTPEQFGLTRTFLDFAQNFAAFSALGVIPVIYKFYPYYKDNLPARQNDLMSWGLVIAGIGFLLMTLVGWGFRSFFEHQYLEKSPLIVQYYYWMFPFGMGMLFFNLLEGYCWAVQESVASNFWKETGLRLLTTVLILFYYFNWLSYEGFIFVFSFLYLAVFLLLLTHLRLQKKLHFHFKISRVTKKFWKKMVAMQALVYSGTLVTSLAATIDIFILAKFQGLASAAVFSLAQYAANLVQVPQRSIQTVSAGILSQAWKDKNLAEISRIYSRSCINLLLMALFVFGNLWLNVADGLQLTGIQAEYATGLSTIFVLGMVRIIDAGTGLNAMVINTSVYWRFDFLSGVTLLILRLPLTYWLIKEYGMLGSAFAELFAYGFYNLVRFEFLRRKFGFQPFTLKTLYALLGAIVCFGAAALLGQLVEGWLAIAWRSLFFSGAFVAFVLWGKITPDAAQLKAVVQKRLGF